MRQSAVEAEHADVSDQGRRGPSQASVLVKIAAERYRLLVDDDGQPYAVTKDGPNIALPLRGNSGLWSQLAKAAEKIARLVGEAGA